jgi:hypothetical protein
MRNTLTDFRQIFLARIHVIDTDNHNYTSVLSRISARQEAIELLCSNKKLVIVVVPQYIQ